MIIKEILRFILFLVKRKNYQIKINPQQATIKTLRGIRSNDFFFGYYDKNPERNGYVLFHEMDNSHSFVRIIVRNLLTEEDRTIAKVSAFNWQMGSRTIWIDNDIVSYNDFDGEKYICCWFSLSKNEVIKVFTKPLQDFSLLKNYYLSVNYHRLCSYAKEYGYYCIPPMTSEEYDNYQDDGIWFVDTKTNETKLLLSIFDVIHCSVKEFPSNAKHFVNHVMINELGNAFIFIHRYYVNGERFDRLMYYDFKNLKCLTDGKIQSHYCWLDNEKIFGYGIFCNQLGFHTINTITGEAFAHNELNRIHPRDGHPTCHNNTVVIDGYPDLSRMQHLIKYDLETHSVVELGEFFHSIRNKGFNRCDLHPRFSSDGKRIYIDTIYSGRRQLLTINLIKG